jgi:EAL and modified HD-GYP domain-containing signal transduction protein
MVERVGSAVVDVLIGRQAIIDRSDAILGYELLFRDSAGNDTAVSVDPDQATARVLVNTFLEFGLADLVGPRLAFVNVTRPFFTGEYPLPFAPGQIVLEIIETVDVDDVVVAGLRRLVEQGFTLALDHYTVGRVPPDVLNLVKYVKCDAGGGGTNPDLELTVTELRGHPDLVLIAERVETEEQFAHCRQLGFEYFQGYLFSRPRILTSTSVGPNRLACLELLSRLARPDVSAPQLEECIRLEPALSYRLLRAINSSSAGLSREVTSLRQAIVLLGQRIIRSWTVLLLLADVDPARTELLSSTLTRARMCELLAEGSNGVKPDSAFMVGLLSSLDVLFSEPLPALVNRMTLDPELKAALLHRHGELGRLLSATLAYEQGARPDAALHAGRGAALAQTYLRAVAWSVQMTQSAH